MSTGPSSCRTRRAAAGWAAGAAIALWASLAPSSMAEPQASRAPASAAPTAGRVALTAAAASAPATTPATTTSLVVHPAMRTLATPAGAPDAPLVLLAAPAADPELVATLRRTLEQLGASVVVMTAASGASPAATVATASTPVPVATAVVERPVVSVNAPLAWEGQLRYRYESRTLLDYRLPGTFGRASTQALGERGDVSLMRMRVGASLRLGPGVRGQFSLQDARIMGAEGSPGGTLDNVDLFSAYVDLDSLAARGVSVRVGRQVLVYGDGRVVAGSDWSNAGRGYDGARLRWSTARLQGDAFVSWINEGRLSGDDRLLSGIDVLWHPAGTIEAEGYHFRRDFGDMAWTGESGARGALFDATTGLRSRLARGPVEARIEGAVQRGSRASDPVSAWFGAARVTVELRSAWKSKLLVEHVRASGDRSPTDGRFQRFDPMYWGGHGYQGAIDVVGASNLADWCGGVTSQPAPGWTLQSELHDFSLMQAIDYWVDDAGTPLRRDVAGTAGRHLGQELDVTARWDLRPRVSVHAGVSRFWAGAFVRGTGGGGDLTWGFTQMTVTF